MAGKQDLSIYDDRSTIGTPDELDEYGVWVKSEPEDLLSDVSLPETEELPDFDSLAEDFSGHSGGAGFDASADSENDFTTAGSAGVSAPGAADLSTQLLLRIADELSSIKKELSSLKTELSAVKNSHQERQAAHEKPGFFGEEDDEKIALTGDELNNILSTTSLTGPKTEAAAAAPAATGMDFDAAAAPDFAESETGDTLLDDMLSVEGEPASLDSEFSPDDALLQDGALETLTDETLDFDGLTPQTGDTVELEEFSDTTFDDALEKLNDGTDGSNETDEFDISFDVTSSFDLTEAVDAPLNAKNLDSFQDDVMVRADFELMEEPASSGEGPRPPQENTAYLEEPPLASFSGEDLDLSDAVIEEPDLSDSITENPLEEPSFDGISLEDDTLGGISIDMEEEPAGQEDDRSVEDSFSIDAEDLIEIPFLDSLLAEPVSEPQELETQAPEPALSNETLLDETFADTALLDESLALSTEDDDISFADYLGLDSETESPAGTEPSESPTMNFETEDPLADIMPELTEEPLEGGAEMPAPSGEKDAAPRTAGEETIPPHLKKELKTVLSYMDQLLESLPEEKIEEFAKSEYFDTYKRLFEELGIV